MAPPESLPPPDASADDIRRAADEVLARPEFRQPPKTAIERAREAIAELLQDAIDALLSGGRSGIVAWAAVLIVGGLAAVVVVRALAGMRRDPSPGSGRRATADVERRRPAASWEREAEEHAAAGRWRDAVRCRYRALVARLADAGAVDDLATRTAGEHRDEVRRTRPSVERAFGDATDVFERAWYGDLPTGPDDDARLRAAAERVAETR